MTERIVVEQDDGLGVHRLVERRPTAVTLELGAGFEQFSTATTAGIETVAPFVEKFAGARSLGSRLTEDVELFGREDLAPLVLGALARVVCHAPH